VKIPDHLCERDGVLTNEGLLGSIVGGAGG